MEDLLDRATAAARRIAGGRGTRGEGESGEYQLAKGKAARRTACAGTLSKAMQKNVGASAPGTAEEQASWTTDFCADWPWTLSFRSGGSRADERILGCW